MRFLSFFAFAVMVGCGGSSAGPLPGDDRVTASPTPFPEEPTTTRGPSGYVTMFSIDGTFVALPAFFPDADRPTERPRPAGCVIDRAKAARESEVSAGTLSIGVPTRAGEEHVELAFDPKEGRYEFQSFAAELEPGGLLRVAAAGGAAPAFEADLKAAANVVFDVPEIVELDANAPADVEVAWTAEGDNEETFVDLGLGDASVTCSFDSKAGRGTIPAALVAEVLKDAPATCARTTCMMFMASKRTRLVATGEWSVLLAHGIATIKEVRVTR